VRKCPGDWILYWEHPGGFFSPSAAGDSKDTLSSMDWKDCNVERWGMVVFLILPSICCVCGK
jgi:hypothetical protein